MILATSEERALLLRTGFTGSQVEKLFLLLNNFTVIREKETRPPQKEDEVTPTASSSYPVCAAEAVA